MRALFIIHELGPNGAVSALLEQARHMTGKGDCVTVLTPPLSGDFAFLAPHFLAAGIQLVTEAEFADFDVAVVCTILNWELVPMIAGRLPVAWWVLEGQCGVAIVAANPGAQRAFAQCDRLIFPSRIARDRIFASYLYGLPASRSVVISLPARMPAAVAPMDKPSGRLRIVSVGSLYPRKRHIDLARAVASVPDLPLECIFVGSIQLVEPDLAALFQGHPSRFRLTGPLHPEQVDSVYASADIFCHPSGDEAQGIAPLEAGRHRLPVVVADLPCYEGIWRHGASALIHPGGDHVMLAWYLRMLAATPEMRRRLGDEAFAVASQFDARSYVSQFDATLDEAIAAKACRKTGPVGGAARGIRMGADGIRAF